MTILLTTALGGAALFALAGITAHLARHRSAACRSLFWRAALVGAVILPVAASLLPGWEIAVLPAAVADESARSATGPAFPAAGDAVDAAVTQQPSLAATEARAESHSPPATDTTTPVRNGDRIAGLGRAAERGSDPAAALVTVRAVLLRSATGVWMLGVLLFATPVLVGSLRMLWIAARARTLTDPELLATCARHASNLGLRRPVAIAVSDSVAVPLAWHLLRPRLLVPGGFEGWPRARQSAVLLHELAHVRRNDGRIQILASLALALHWFDPLAWVAYRGWRHERERACDDLVLAAGVRPSSYAADLVALGAAARARLAMPAVAPSFARRGTLAARVRAILDPSTGRRSPAWSTRMSVSLTALALVVALAGFRPVPAPAAPPAPQAIPAPALSPVASSPGVEPAAARAEQPAAHAEPVAPTTPAGTAAPVTPSPQSASPSLSQLVQMRIHGVTPEFIEGVRDYLGGDVSVERLVTLRIHGVNADYGRAMTEQLGPLDADQLVQMRIHGASPEWVRSMETLLDRDLTHSQVIQMRIHGASTEWVREMNELLPEEELSPSKLVQMRIHGVSTELVRELREAGYEDLTADELVRIKIHGFDRILAKRRGGSR